MFKKFHISDINLTKYLFFTGKGGVGKTSTACDYFGLIVPVQGVAPYQQYSVKIPPIL